MGSIAQSQVDKGNGDSQRIDEKISAYISGCNFGDMFLLNAFFSYCIFIQYFKICLMFFTWGIP